MCQDIEGGITKFINSFEGDLFINSFGRRGGLMVSALDSGASGPGSSPGRGPCVVFLGKTLTPTVPLVTQVYKWVLANLLLGVTLRWTSIPSEGGVQILSVASCYRNLHSGQTTGHARDLRTSGDFRSGHFPVSSHKISMVSLLHSSHLGTN